MTENNLEIIKKLRARTSASFKDCINALKESKNDIEQAVDFLRLRGQVIANQKSDRETHEGVISFSRLNNIFSLIELRSETDFASRQQIFRDFASKIADKATQSHSQSVQELLQSYPEIEAQRTELILQLRENIKISAIKTLTSENGGYYVHNNAIGCIIDLNGGNNEIANNIAMHIVAYKPIAISRELVAADILQREKSLYLKQASEISSKNHNIQLEKIIDGKLNKFFKENILLEQSFLKNNEITVQDYLEEHNASIINFEILSLK
jgi:elongation factor Ts